MFGAEGFEFRVRKYRDFCRFDSFPRILRTGIMFHLERS